MNRPSSSARRHWLWLLAGIVVVLAAFPLDGTVDRWLDATGHAGRHRVAWWCSKAGEGWVVAVAGILGAAIFLLARRSRIAADIFFVAFTSELTGLAATILRVLFGRTRPTAPVPQGFYGVWYDGHWLLGKYQFSAFPSGHTATAVGLAAAAWLVHRGWGAVAFLYALAVAWSRIALDCHHLSDVLASTVLGIAGAMLMKHYFKPANDRWRCWRWAE